MGHARALLGARDIEALAEQVIAKGLSVRETERLAKGAKPQRALRSSGVREPSGNADIAALERQLSDLLGLNVRISHADSGGTLTLAYSTLDQLDMVCQRLTGDDAI
jgi:ParB family chromosome partitioning protein